MVDKAVKLSKPRFLDGNLKIIQCSVVNNHYLPNFIDTYINKRLHYTPPSPVENVYITDKVYGVTFPIISQIAHKIKRMSKKYKFDTVFSNRKKTNLYFDKCKDKGYVYKILCNNCKKVYIGHTTYW